jgi:hypothetical protein
MDAAYLNATVAGPLAEALELVARFQPADPVAALAHLLLQKGAALGREEKSAAAAAAAAAASITARPQQPPRRELGADAVTSQSAVAAVRARRLSTTAVDAGALPPPPSPGHADAVTKAMPRRLAAADVVDAPLLAAVVAAAAEAVGAPGASATLLERVGPEGGSDGNFDDTDVASAGAYARLLASTPGGAVAAAHAAAVGPRGRSAPHVVPSGVGPALWASWVRPPPAPQTAADDTVVGQDDGAAAAAAPPQPLPAYATQQALRSPGDVALLEALGVLPVPGAVAVVPLAYPCPLHADAVATAAVPEPEVPAEDDEEEAGAEEEGASEGIDGGDAKPAPPPPPPAPVPTPITR